MQGDLSTGPDDAGEGGLASDVIGGQPFSPDAGLRVETVSVPTAGGGTRREAWVTAYGRLNEEISVDGRPATFQLLVAEDADVRACGRLDRERHLAEAICRWFNTGGSAAGLAHVAHRIATMAAAVVPYPQANGYDLVYSEPRGDGVWEHLFLKGEDDALCWYEGESTNLTDWASLAWPSPGDGSEAHDEEAEV